MGGLYSITLQCTTIILQGVHMTPVHTWPRSAGITLHAVPHSAIDATALYKMVLTIQSTPGLCVTCCIWTGPSAILSSSRFARSFLKSSQDKFQPGKVNEKSTKSRKDRQPLGPGTLPCHPHRGGGGGHRHMCRRYGWEEAGKVNVKVKVLPTRVHIGVDYLTHNGRSCVC